MGRAICKQKLVSHERNATTRQRRDGHAHEEGKPLGGRAQIDLLLDRVNELEEIDDGDESRGQRQPDVAPAEPVRQHEAKNEIKTDANEADACRHEENDVPHEMTERIPEAGRCAGLEARRLHRVKAGHENLDAGITGEADGVGLQRQRSLLRADRREGAVLVDELDDRLRDHGQTDRRGKREIKTEAQRVFHRFAEGLEVIQRVLARDGG